MQDKASNPENTRYLAQKFHKDKRQKTTAHVVTSCDRKTRANQASTTRATTRRNIFRLPFSTLWPQAASHSRTTLELRQMMRFTVSFLPCTRGNSVGLWGALILISLQILEETVHHSICREGLHNLFENCVEMRMKILPAGFEGMMGPSAPALHALLRATEIPSGCLSLSIPTTAWSNAPAIKQTSWSGGLDFKRRAQA